MKAKKKLSLIIISFFTLLITSCSSQEQKLQNSFVEKVWVIDSIKSKGVDSFLKNKGQIGGSMRSWNNILRPTKSGEFEIYKDQIPWFKEYKISNDTLFLKRKETTKFEPFKFDKMNEFTYRLKSISNNPSIDEYEYYLTDLTDLFNGKVDNAKSTFYNKVHDKTWYPVEKWTKGEEVYNNMYPDYYIKDVAFAINEDKLLYSKNFPENCIIKTTEKGMYIFDPKEKELVIVFEVDLEDNYMSMIDNNSKMFYVKYRQIDETILKESKDLPKKIRLNCSENIAKYMIEDEIKKTTNSRFYYDINTIQLVQKDEENCVYTFTIIYRSKSFDDIYSTHRLEVTYSEDGMMHLKSYN